MGVAGSWTWAWHWRCKADHQGPAADAGQAPGPLSDSSASVCLNDRVREAAKWLQTAFDGGHKYAKLHLAYMAFDAGQEDGVSSPRRSATPS
jgi:hypothetical protein